MADYPQFGGVPHQLCELCGELPDAVQAPPARAAMPTQIDGDPMRTAALLQCPLDTAPDRRRCTQAMQQEHRASSCSTALVPSHRSARIRHSGACAYNRAMSPAELSMSAYKLIIGGKAAAVSSTFDVLNPADGTVITACPQGSPSLVDAAVESARGAFPAWS